MCGTDLRIIWQGQGDKQHHKIPRLHFPNGGSRRRVLSPPSRRKYSARLTRAPSPSLSLYRILPDDYLNWPGSKKRDRQIFPQLGEHLEDEVNRPVSRTFFNQLSLVAALPCPQNTPSPLSIWVYNVCTLGGMVDFSSLSPALEGGTLHPSEERNVPLGCKVTTRRKKEDEMIFRS